MSPNNGHIAIASERARSNGGGSTRRSRIQSRRERSRAADKSTTRPKSRAPVTKQPHFTRGEFFWHFSSLLFIYVLLAQDSRQQQRNERSRHTKRKQKRKRKSLHELFVCSYLHRLALSRPLRLLTLRHHPDTRTCAAQLRTQHAHNRSARADERSGRLRLVVSFICCPPPFFFFFF